MTDKKSILIDDELHKKLTDFSKKYGFKIKAVTETALIDYINNFNKETGFDKTDE